MKATLTYNGIMVIEPENETEAYALKQWAKESKIDLTDSPEYKCFAFASITVQNWEST